MEFFDRVQLIEQRFQRTGRHVLALDHAGRSRRQRQPGIVLEIDEIALDRGQESAGDACPGDEPESRLPAINAPDD